MASKLPATDAFLTTLKTKVIRPGWARVAHHDFKVYSARVDDLIVVPVGFEFDWDSLPRWLPISYALLKDRTNKAACVHDWLYDTGKYSKHLTELIFLDLMKLEGLPWYQRWPIFGGVYAGGGFAWRRHRRG